MVVYSPTRAGELWAETNWSTPNNATKQVIATRYMTIVLCCGTIKRLQPRHYNNAPINVERWRHDCCPNRPLFYGNFHAALAPRPLNLLAIKCSLIFILGSLR